MEERPDMLTQGYRESLKITKKHAKSFYFCSLLLEKEKRMAAYSVYAFARIIDDSFDVERNKDSDKIKRWTETIDLAYGERPLKNPVYLALRDTVKKYDIPAEYFLDLLKGMEMDLVKKEYRDFSELYRYCYRVAGVIGLIMVRIFGYSGESALLYAEKMGIAMQLTNILRDVKEDLEMGRLYLPLDELDKYGVSRESLEKGVVDDNFVDLMKFHVERARSYYDEGYSGIKLISDANSRFIARLMGAIYSGILDSIEKSGYDVLNLRNYVPFGKKVFLTLKTITDIKGSA